MNTIVKVTERNAYIKTNGREYMHIRRINMPEMWQWHEAVSNMVANYHASSMGELMPCPEPELPKDLQSILDTELEPGGRSSLPKALHEQEERRLAAENVSINLTVPKGHPDRIQPPLDTRDGISSRAERSASLRAVNPAIDRIDG